MQAVFKMTDENKVFYKTLVVLCIPIIIQNLISTLVNMVDTVMVGSLGEVSVAAIGIANQYFFLFNMALSGINKIALSKLNGKAICYVNLEEVHKEAKEKQITRSMAAVEKACNDNVDIFVFGNAPTALFKLKELIKDGKAKPKLIIAVPVGFVGAAESKENLEELNVPYIRVKGRKGGSTVAAAIVNALMYNVVER